MSAVGHCLMHVSIDYRESVAIILYLVDKYDPEHKLSVSEASDEKYQQLQWLLFQASGQGLVHCSSTFTLVMIK